MNLITKSILLSILFPMYAFASGAGIGGVGIAKTIDQVSSILSAGAEDNNVFVLPDDTFLNVVGNINSDEMSAFKSKLNVQPQGLVLKDGMVIVEAYSYTQGEQIYFVSSSQFEDSSHLQLSDFINSKKVGAVRLTP